MELRIVLFDDNDGHRQAVRSALVEELEDRGSVQEFRPGAGGMEEGVFEERLVKDLTSAPNTPVDLIVADRDLSAYKPEYRGLSESTVRRAADMIGVPECGYARGERDDDDEFVKRGDQRESCIRLSRRPADRVFAKRVVAVGKGFKEIATKLESLTLNPRRSPGQLLAEVLGKKEYAEKISLYASGDQKGLGALDAHTKDADPITRRRRLACVLGYWLWDSVLRFPGVFVNEVAASSYLNIDLDAFMDSSELRELFDQARYRGPFAAARLSPLWWRGMLDDIIADGNAVDGRTFAAERLRREVPPSRCCEDQSSPAGYYCFLSEKPVSLRNSRAGLPWFPRGADLARVSKRRYEEDEPWL